MSTATENGQPILKVVNLKKSYGETRALVALNLQGRRGTVHTVFGENGSGKSTLMKILSGIIPPDEGQVIINDLVVRRFEPNAMRWLGIAAVFQEVLVAPNRSVMDNVLLGYDGLFKRRIAREARPTLVRETLNLITRSCLDLEVQAGALPLAQQQLIVIARALVRNPQILILDEVTAALDMEDRERLFKYIRQFVSDGRLVFFISHRIDEVLELSDEITVLQNGSSVASVSGRGLTAEQLLALVCSTETTLACDTVT